MKSRFTPVVRLTRVLRRVIADGAFSIAMGLAVLCMLMAVSGAQDTSAPTTTAIESTPPGARVIVDDIMIGRTPLESTTLPGTASRLTMLRKGSIPAVVDLEGLRASASGAQPLRIHRELQPEVQVPHRFDPASIPAFLVGRADAQSLLEEVASNLELGHIRRPTMQHLCASAAEAIFDGLAGLKASVARRRQVLGDGLADQIYGKMVELDGVPGVDCVLRGGAEGDDTVALEVGIDDIDFRIFEFPADPDAAIAALMSAYDLARQVYDPSGAQIRDDALAVLAVQGMLDSLRDRHTHYSPPVDRVSFANESEGHVSGIGIHVGADVDGTVIVVGTLAGSPAYEGGIEPGDTILAVDDSIARPYEVAPIIEALRGPPGSSTRLSVARMGEVLDPIVVERRLLPLRCSASFYFSSGEIGYLRLDSFPGDWVIDELRHELQDLQDLGMRRLVIDVRGNAGGLLDQAAGLADLFVDEGLLVTTSSPLPQIEGVQVASAEATTVPAAVQVAVLVDGGTASAAEILAGCLQDHQRALLIGEHTYGKGTVQVQLPLDDARGVLTLSVGRYYLPGGRCVSGKGLHPDLVVDVNEVTRRRLRSRSIYSRDDPRTGDPQLEAAIVYLRTRPPAEDPAGTPPAAAIGK